MARELPWEAASHLPWHHFNSPADQWAVLPSFVVGEFLFITLALICLWHAIRSGRDHVLVWVAALIAGTANDMIFMALPLVDNFWQAQGMFMLTPRMPLYIPCVYVCFMYLPTVAVRRLGWPPLPTAALAGLAGIAFYAPYDIIGAKFLWWTWHDTDQPIAARLLGVPTSSSLWVITFVGAFAWLIGRATRKDPAVSGATFAKGLVMVAGLTTFIMMVQMTILQQLDGGTPRYIALGVAVALYAGTAVRGWMRGPVNEGLDGAATASGKDGEPAADGMATPWTAHRTLLVAIIGYYAVLAGVMALFDPTTHRSTGIHQLPGKCYVEAIDITGNKRFEFLCVRDFDEDYTFDCAEPPADGSEWYTVCGKAHRHFVAWMLGVLACGVVGGGLYTLLLSKRPAHRSAPSRRSAA